MENDAVEIVDFPTERGDFPVRYVNHDQRVKIPLNPIKPPLNHH